MDVRSYGRRRAARVWTAWRALDRDRPPCSRTCLRTQRAVDLPAGARSIYRRPQTRTEVFLGGGGLCVKRFGYGGEQTDERARAFRRRSLNEARALRLLARELLLPGACVHFVVPVALHLGPDRATLVTEAVDGPTLADWVQGPEADDRRLRAVLFQCLVALAHAQARWPSFRHNDLHAANVLLDQRTQRGRAAHRLPGQPGTVFREPEPPAETALLFDLYYCVLHEDPHYRAAAGAAVYRAHAEVPMADAYTLLDSLCYVHQGSHLPDFSAFADRVLPDAVRYLSGPVPRDKAARAAMYTRQPGQRYQTPLEMLAADPYFEAFRQASV
jgi:hypothetical protein